jgi:hypothetical protein
MREVDRINKKLWLLNHNLVGNQKGGRNVSLKGLLTSNFYIIFNFYSFEFHDLKHYGFCIGMKVKRLE